MMLSNLAKKLCPLMSLALAFGCGKKINDPETTDANSRPPQTQELPAELTIQIIEAISPFKTFLLPENGWFKLPTKLLAKEGNAIGKKVKIFYNLLSSGEYEFHCSYRSTVKVTELAFENCQSSDGLEIISNSEDLESMFFPMVEDTSIKVQLTNPTGTGMKIESAYIVDWKN